MSPFPPPALGGAASLRREKLGNKPSKPVQLQVLAAAQDRTAQNMDAAVVVAGVLSQEMCP